MNPQKSFKTASVLLFGVFLANQSAAVTWNGLGDGSSWLDGNNWVGGSPPPNSDFNGNALFDSTATPTTITLGSSRDANRIEFATAGWTITGSSFTDIDDIVSSGAGTNQISNVLNLLESTAWTINNGNTLITDNLYLRNYTLSIDGGGTHIFTSGLDGYGSGTFGVSIGAVTLQSDTSSVFDNISNNAFVRLNDPAAVFNIAGSTTNAQSLIDNGRVYNNTGSGTLQVTDLGNGYAQVTIVPEPSHYAVLFASALTLGVIYRRRKHS